MTTKLLHKNVNNFSTACKKKSPKNIEAFE